MRDNNEGEVCKALSWATGRLWWRKEGFSTAFSSVYLVFMNATKPISAITFAQVHVSNKKVLLLSHIRLSALSNWRKRSVGVPSKVSKKLPRNPKTKTTDLDSSSL